MKADLKVALVHDWLNGMRGGEKVLEVLCELFPQAEIYTLLYEPEKISAVIRRHPVHTGMIQRLPLAKRYYRHYLPLFPMAVEQFDLRGYDLVISSSHCVAKGVLTEPDTVHICYCHTPMRYAWEQYYEYFPPERLNWFSRRFIPWAISRLRVWDVASSRRVDAFLANSQHVAKRIRKYYGRESQVVNPPVTAGRFAAQAGEHDFYLVVSALVPYKRIDRALAACRLAKRKLVIVGSGPEEKKLRQLAGPEVTFVAKCGDEQLTAYYAQCRALLFPGEEDFGITPLEAMASGRPVIAFAKGGVLETVLPGKTGVFFHEPTAEAMAQAMIQAEKITWDSAMIRRRALAFDRPVFKRKIAQVIETIYRQYQSGPVKGKTMKSAWRD